MTLQFAAGLGFAIGAVLFFAAGFLLARVRRSSASDPPRAGDGQTAEGSEESGEISADSPELAQANRRISGLQKNTAVLERQKAALEKKREEFLRQLKKDLAYIEGQQKELRAKDAELQRKTDALGEAEAQNEKLRTELQEAKSRVQELTDTVNSMEASEAGKKDLSLQVSRMSEQLEELETLKQENRELQSYKNTAKELEAEVKELKSENAKLHSMKIFWDAPPQPVVPVSKEGLGQMFQLMVNRLSESRKARGAALADELGLMVAGTSDHAEALAGMGAVLTETNATLESMLPFGTIDHVKIVNQNELTLMMRPVTISGNDLILSTLTVGEGPGRNEVEKLLREITS